VGKINKVIHQINLLKGAGTWVRVAKTTNGWLDEIKDLKKSYRGASIIRAFLKQEPRFRMLSHRKQLKVLRLGIQYRRTTVQSMKAKVDAFI
jgi:hypothetical protein